MNNPLTKNDLEDILDVKFGQYQAAFVEAIDLKFQRVDSQFSELGKEVREIKAELSEMQQAMRDLTTTLDNFLKRLTDREEEMKLMQADIAKIKAVLKEKLGVEVLI